METKTKTIEAVRADVLAECELVCPKDGVPISTDFGKLVFGYVIDELDKQYETWFIWLDGARVATALYALTPNGAWIAAYRLLGLEARDAVAQIEAESRLIERKSLVKALRSFTGCSSDDCLRALDANAWDCYNAALRLRSNGPTVNAIIEQAVKEKDGELKASEARADKLVEALKNTNLAIVDVLEHGDDAGKLRVAHRINSEALGGYKKGGPTT